MCPRGCVDALGVGSDGHIRALVLAGAVCGSPSLDDGDTKSEVAHKWAGWLHKPYRSGRLHRLRTGEKLGPG